MISSKSALAIPPLKDEFVAKFKYIDRNKKDLLVLIPGWATDYRIFTALDLEFNYLIPLNFSPFTFKEDLIKELREKAIEKISLFGWSLGGFVGAELAAQYTNLIDRIILVSIRKKYKNESLEVIRKHLMDNKRGFLYKFYRRCFSKQEKYCFRESLLKNYCKELSLSYLLEGLDYLENAEINPKMLKNIKKIKIIHGEHDSITPIQEAIDIKESVSHAKFACIKKTGHLPFLRNDFGRYI